ncbi:MAG: hypothetical protein R3E13_09820 [Alphaproteobacteria bacterium]
MKQSEENTKKCKELKNELDKINREISKHEKEIENIKRDRNALDNKRRKVRADLKNKMTEFGVSIDFITDALVPSRFTAILKAGSDAIGAPSASEIERLMNQVFRMEKEIESKEKDVMREAKASGLWYKKETGL